MANVKVRYIGTKPVKRDTVAGSLATWFGQNSVADVSEEVAAKLLQYPTVWRPADMPVIERPTLEPAPTQNPSDELNIGAGKQEGNDPPAGDDDTKPPAPTGDVTPEEITEILPLLDKDTDFTEAGRPMVNKVREHFEGREVTLQALKAAWENFKAVE